MEKAGHDNPGLELDTPPGQKDNAAQDDYADQQSDKPSSKNGDPKELTKKEEDVIEVGGDDDDDTFEDLEFDPGSFMAKVDRVHSYLWDSYEKGSAHIWLGAKVALFLAYNGYLLAAVYHYYATSEDGEGPDWCDGLGFLVILTVMVYGYVLYSRLLVPAVTYVLVQTKPGRDGVKMVRALGRKVFGWRFTTPLLYLLVIASITIFLILDSADDRGRLVSGLGIGVLVFVGFLCSKHPGHVVWRHVVWGLALQFVFGFLSLRWSVGRAVFKCLGRKVSTFLAFTDQGSSFVFGYLVSKEAFNPSALDNSSLAHQVALDMNANKAMNFVFMFQVLSVIYFFSFFVSMLFYLGAMQWLVIKLGWLLQMTVGTTACESVSCAANIFLGQTESPLLIKPFLPKMTNSEMHSVMTGGFATIAGGALAAYISFGISPTHLLTASVMSAPAALACAKLMYPETKKSKTTATSICIEAAPEANILDAATKGAVTAVFLVANIAGSLVAILAFIGFLNGVLGWLGSLVGIVDLSFESILGWCFIPLAAVMGVPHEDLRRVGTLIGLKTFVNEFAAYDRLKQMDNILQPRSKVIATYALCGFSNPASIGIQIAALGTMAPSRQGDLAKVAFRAFVSGSLACFLTACVAGALIET